MTPRIRHRIPPRPKPKAAKGLNVGDIVFILLGMLVMAEGAFSLSDKLIGYLHDRTEIQSLRRELHNTKADLDTVLDTWESDLRDRLHTLEQQRAQSLPPSPPET